MTSLYRNFKKNELTAIYHLIFLKNNTIGDTGGEYEHTLTISEMPSHRHNITMPMSTVWNSNGGAGFQLDSTIEATETYTDKIGFTGGESSHNNIQPYITVYFWKRIS